MGYFPKEWLVCFYNPPNEEWYHIFRKKGIGHCFLLGFDVKKKLWIIIEHVHKRLDVKILTGEEASKLVN